MKHSPCFNLNHHSSGQASCSMVGGWVGGWVDKTANTTVIGKTALFLSQRWVHMKHPSCFIHLSSGQASRTMVGGWVGGQNSQQNRDGKTALFLSQRWVHMKHPSCFIHLSSGQASRTMVGGWVGAQNSQHNRDRKNCLIPIPAVGAHEASIMLHPFTIHQVRHHAPWLVGGRVDKTANTTVIGKTALFLSQRWVHMKHRGGP